MAIGFGIASRNWWRAQIKGGVSPSFSLDFATISDDFTFTRSSFATRVNELGLIETVTDLGNELVVNGDFATDSDWAFSNLGGLFGWNITDGRAICDETGVANGRNLQQFLGTAITSGKRYKVSLDILQSDDNIALLIGGQNISLPTGTNLGYETTFVASSTSTLITFFAGTSNTQEIDNVSVKEVLEDDVPRIDYSTGEAAFLLEPQSTNLLPYSEDFSNSNWIKGGDTTIQSGFLAPDGTLSAYKVSGTSSALQYNSVTNTTDTRTIYARTVSGTATANLCSFNGNTNNVFTITEDWQRFEVNGAISTGANTFYAVDFRGTTTLTEILLWGGQVEALPYATSYIPTNGTTVTRAAETCVKSNLSTDGIFGGKEGTILLHVTDMAVVGTSLNNLTPLRLYRQVSDSYRFYYETDASFIGGNIDLSNKGGELKMAFSVSETDVKIYVNGSLHASYTYVNPLPSDLETWVWETETKYKERVKDFKIYDKALTDDELIELTSI